MSAVTSIAWTNRSWNPIRGCSVVSPGCHNCYAMKQAHRFSGTGRAYEGLTKKTKAGPQWTGTIRLVEDALLEPLRWRKPARVFVNSMSDLFHDGVPDDFIDRVFTVMALCSQHTFQILTKRPERMRNYLSAWSGGFPCITWMDDLSEEMRDRWDAARRWLRSALLARGERASMGRPEYVGVIMAHQEWPLKNVWLGTSVENQETADARIPPLLDTPAAVRFISAEPLLAPVDLTYIHGVLDVLHGGGRLCDPPSPWGLDWVIVGGESGAKARPCDVSWIRAIVKQCRAADVPCFFKQGGTSNACSHDRKGGCLDCVDHDLRVREFPYARV